MKTNHIQPQPTREFLATFGAYRVGDKRKTEALVTEMEAKLAEARTKTRPAFWKDVTDWEKHQERGVNVYTYLVQVARARRAQFFGVRL